MIWLAILALSVLAMAPLAWRLRRDAPGARGRRDPALLLQRAQLAELDRDLAEGRIGPGEHASARLEVQRRMLATAAEQDPPPLRASALPVVLCLVLVPVAACLLYLAGGRPDLPGAPLAERIAASRGRAAEDGKLIEELKRSIAQLPPSSEQARQGYVILGQAEASLGQWFEAAAAWRQALSVRFDPTIAAEAAEAATRAEGHVSPNSAALFRQALAAAPADVPWHAMAVDRLAQSENHH